MPSRSRNTSRVDDSAQCAKEQGVLRDPLLFPCRLAPAAARTADYLRSRHVPLGLAGVQLTRTPDLVVGIGQHLVPLRDPAHRTRQREDGGEQRSGNTDGTLHDTRIEVNVRVQLALDEVR